MNVVEFLTDLAQQGVQLWADGDELSVRAPKGVLTAARREQLLQRKPELLALLRQRQEKDRSFLLPQIVPAPEDRHLPFPLTDIQGAYWIGRTGVFESGSVACQAYFEFESVGLNLERLQLAWQRLVERHDMLRAIVLPTGQQQILDNVPSYQFEVLDLREQPVQAVSVQLETIRETMSHRVSRLDLWPLFEIRATHLDNGRLRLHVRIELIIADAWSIILLLKYWSERYLEPDAVLEPLELSFRDYVLAEGVSQSSEQYQRCKDYWLGRLLTLPPAPELPLAQNPASIKQQRFVRRMARLEKEQWGALKARAAKSGVTSSAILCTAFSDVLRAWSKNPRFTLDVTFFNRLPVHPQIKDIVGDFTSTLLLEVDGSPATFELRAKRLQEQLGKDLEYSHFSGVRVLRELNRLRGGATAAGAPIVFTSGLSVHGEETPPGAHMGEVIYSVSQTPQVWLDHQAFEQAGTLFVSWDAVEALFPEGLLDDMFDAYSRLLHRLADEEVSWREPVRHLIPAKQIEQREAVNTTDAPVSKELLHGLFTAQAIARPHHPAIISSVRTLTYEELSHRASQVARWLRAAGARPNRLVAVVMEKGWEQVVAVLGVLQSGAAYVPIEPELPRDRVWYLLESSEVELVLTQSRLNDALDWPETVTRFAVDEAVLDEVGGAPIEPIQASEDLAYVIHTSGSTGFPKGVMIDHRGAVNTILDVNRRFAVGPEDRILALSSLSFDLSVYDVFGALAAGATIVIPDAGQTRNPAHWAELMMRERVTLWNSVPALMEMLVEYAAGPGVMMPSLRCVLLSGDWIPLNLPERVRALAENAQIISMGGATEASIWSILYAINDVHPSWKSIPYGRPMTNQRFHVLNEALEPCPVWVAGLLYIGGIGLATGYWRDEEKTSGSFIVHPESGERLYRTGDWGRYLPDGNIEFLGREDFQVKVSGHRIELGEIESALALHASVRSAVVTAAGEKTGRKRLLAYLVAADDPAPSAAELSRFLKQKLPEYMVPSGFIFLDALPLTPNGKVNRQALPAPEALHSALETAYVPPRTDVERTIVAIWQEALQREKVGVHDNFFDLGGNSLLMVQVHNRLRQVFQRETLLVHMFEHPTVSALAGYLSQSQEQPSALQQSAARGAARRDFISRRDEWRNPNVAVPGGKDE
jgi:pyochelin synthetase